MEAILDVSAEPYDRCYPVESFDESPDPWVREGRQLRPVVSGHPVRYNDAYRWEGTCHLLIVCQPLAGWRHVEVTDRRPARDYAPCMKALVERSVPKADDPCGPGPFAYPYAGGFV
jgi:hypothetical protein